MGKTIETKTCKNCNVKFTITDRDMEFYDKISPVLAGKKYPIPTPRLCPDCRLQRRQSWRNERSLYRRICDASGKQIISVYSPDKPYKIYDHKIWRSDQWDPMEYGQAIDLNKSFFQQYEELMLKVPRIAMMINRCENTDYAPYSVDSKNCYMCVSIIGSEDIYYSYQVNASHDSVDSSLCYDSELCYECTYATNLYGCSWTNNCKDSSDLLFCRDCEGCDHCIGCVNLKDKKFHIFNKPVEEYEYLEMAKKFGSKKFVDEFAEKFKDFSSTFPIRENHNINCENVVGDHLNASKDSFFCFDAENLEDCAYIHTLPRGAKDCYDTSYSPGAELSYEAMSGVDNYNCKFLSHARDDRDCMYVDECYNSDNLFGCIGLRNQQYCILNKQYTKEEYEKLVPQIIDQMTKAGEWGEYLPRSISPFGYNETLAMEYFPLSKEEAIKKGFKRSDHEAPLPKVEKTVEFDETMDDIKDITDEILNQVLVCEISGKPFRIIKAELEFYRKRNLPIPHKHPDIRNKERMKTRNSRKFRNRKCDKCSIDIKTTYSSEIAKIVYCEACYDKEIYG